jgi:hypothetical protein
MEASDLRIASPVTTESSVRWRTYRCNAVILALDSILTVVREQEQTDAAAPLPVCVNEQTAGSVKSRVCPGYPVPGTAHEHHSGSEI